jgi:hypothetical protein
MSVTSPPPLKIALGCVVFWLAAAVGAAQSSSLAWEADTLTRTSSAGTTTALQNDPGSTGGTWLALLATATGAYVDYTLPNVPSGTYILKMSYKAHPNRGILSVQVDGTPLSGTLDQYAADPVFPTATLGTVTFATTGNHVVRLTVVGKNTAAGAYTLSSDQFFLVDTVVGPIGQLATPVFSPAAGPYSGQQSVTIASATSGATIRYTTDGSIPIATNGTLYSGPIIVARSTTLQAIAYASGAIDSDMATATYSILQAATPSFSHGTGTYSSAQSVTISSANPGATIRYTTDGSTPSAMNGTVYSGPVAIDVTKTLRAIASAAGLQDSAAASVTCTINIGVPNGRPILPPKWAFGVLFGCYKDQNYILNTALPRLRSDYCGDALWVDSSWLNSSYTTGADRYIDFKFDAAQFPDPAAMISTLHTNHFRFGVWEWPLIDVSNSFYAYGRDHHYFVENSSHNVLDSGGWHGVTFTGEFDFTYPDAVAWWNSLQQPLLDLGLDFFKIDTNGAVPSGGVLHDGTSSSNATNRYRQAYHATVYANTTKATGSQGRGFILAHRYPSTGYVNDQYPGMWTGDSSATFSSFATFDMANARALNSTSTAAYWCGDTGGYNQNPTDELYIRWLQYSSFTPLQEFFGAKDTSTITRFPWDFGPKAQQIFKTYTQLRYRLLPFRYSNAQVCYQEAPVKYPVWWPSAGQIVLGNGASQMLVQPITTAGATSATVMLPAGASWIHYWSGAVYAGGTTVTVAAPLEQVPLFVKAGSIIPLGPTVRYVDELPADPLTLDVYPAGKTSYTFYEDDGATTGYINGDYAKTEFISDNTPGREMFTIGATLGTYTGQLDARTYLLKIDQQPAGPSGVARDGTALPACAAAGDLDAATTGWFYDAGAQILWAKIRLARSESATVAVIDGPAAAPVFSPEQRIYSSGTWVALSSATSGATIHYTRDGSTPTASTGTVYNAPIWIDSTTTIKAMATAPTKLNSAVASATYSFVAAAIAPAISQPPMAQTGPAGSGAILTVVGSGTGPITYQWYHDGTAIAGATSSSLEITSLRPADAGSYSVQISNPAGNIMSPAATIGVTPGSRLINVSIRSAVGSASSPIVGFVVGGESTTGAKPLLVRAAGPTLANFGVTGALADPKLAILNGQVVVAENDDWSGLTSVSNASAAVGAFPFSSPASKDAAVVFSTGNVGYTVQITAATPGTGIALAEVYDTTANTTLTTPRLINVSARTLVGTGDNVLIAGFAVAGPTPKTLLIRGVGPALNSYGVRDALADPKLQLFRDSVLLQENDNWSLASNATDVASAAVQVGAFPLPLGGKDSALLAQLPPGTYSAVVSGMNGTVGTALVEVYEVP